MKGLIFDMDGVLIDSSQSYDRTIKETVRFFTNGTIVQKEIESIRLEGGFNNDWDLCDALLQRRGFYLSKQAIIDRFQLTYREYFYKDEQWLLRSEIIENLKTRYRTGIVSGRPVDEIVQSLERFRMAHCFDCIVGMEDVLKPKPDPEGILIAKSALSIEEGYYIGDTVDDIQASRAAKLQPIAIIKSNLSKRQREKIHQYGAVQIMDNINQITEVINDNREKNNQ